MKKYSLALLLALSLLCIFTESRHKSAFSAVPIEFYYFNPDSPQNNLERLKLEMENFLAGASNKIHFQPFARLNDFDDKVKEKKPAFTLLPSWYLDEFGKNLGIRPLLMPVRDGVTSYRKVLLAAKDSQLDTGSIGGHSLAMTSMGPSGKGLIREALFPRGAFDTEKMNIILVPKDSDALIALTLKQVDMALVGKHNFESITKINRKMVESVKIIAESESIPMPALCYREGSVTGEQIEELKNLFLSAGKASNKSTIMEMLHIDGWQTFSQ